MGSRIPSHQLKSGLYVSGRPDHLHHPKPPTLASRAAPPYTGGDVKKSGDLGKMFDIPILQDPPPSPPPPPPPSSRLSSASNSHSQHNSGPVRSGPNSGPIRKSSSSSGPLMPTGLITSGPLSSSSGPLRRSGAQLDASGTGAGTGSTKSTPYGSSVTSLGHRDLKNKVGFRVSKAILWLVMVVVAMALLVGAFLMVAVKKPPIILVAGGGLLVPLVVGLVWNCAWGRRGLMEFVKTYPDAELRGAVDGQFVKVTGVVTCGSIPLESSYQRVPRCVYVSTELYEYRGWGGKSAHPKHRFFSWGCRHSEKYVADFYVSDFQSGLRALVKAGYGAKVAPFVKPATVVDVAEEKKDLSPTFLRWLADHNLSSDDRIMRLKEGYIKEGSTVSVMGVVRRHENVLMIVPPQEPVSTGCRWSRCLLPTYVEGLVVTCDDNQDTNVVAV